MDLEKEAIYIKITLKKLSKVVAGIIIFFEKLKVTKKKYV